MAPPASPFRSPNNAARFAAIDGDRWDHPAREGSAIIVVPIHACRVPIADEHSVGSIDAQNTADLFAPDAGGLPLRFTDYLVKGKPATDGSPQQGMLIGQA